MVGWSDLPADLSDTAALARLSAFLPADALILSSDLSRARATADALEAGRRRLADEPRLREMHFGAWELRSFAQVEAASPDRIRAFWERPGDVRPPGGESWHDLSSRVSDATDGLVAEHGGRDIVIVAHFGPILACLQRALDLPTDEVFAQRIEPLSVTVIVHQAGAWSVGAVNHRP